MLIGNKVWYDQLKLGDSSMPLAYWVPGNAS